MDIEIEGLDEFNNLIQEMTITKSDERKAVRDGITVIAEGLENDTPERTGRMAKQKIKIKDTGLGMEGSTRSSAFYDIFEDFGVSFNKKNVGYFERSVRSNQDKAIAEIAEVVFSKIK